MQDTFDGVASWIEEISKYGPPDTPVMVLGSACDLVTHRVVSYEDGRSLADGNDFLFFEVSAKDGTTLSSGKSTTIPKRCSKSSE